jgi:hypothetical protein
MSRAPSLRELRRKLPANVAILSTAPDRQVKQHYGRAYGPAKRALLAGQSITFPFKEPRVRAAERLDTTLELRADVPPFDPRNPAHLRAWESMWDLGQRPWRSDGE